MKIENGIPAKLHYYAHTLRESAKFARNNKGDWLAAMDDTADSLDALAQSMEVRDIPVIDIRGKE